MTPDNAVFSLPFTVVMPYGGAHKYVQSKERVAKILWPCKVAIALQLSTRNHVSKVPPPGFTSTNLHLTSSPANAPWYLITPQGRFWCIHYAI